MQILDFCPAFDLALILTELVAAIPLEEFGKHKNVAIVVTARGGHIGFMEGFLPQIENPYMTRIMTQFFQAVFTDGIHSQSELDSYDD